MVDIGIELEIGKKIISKTDPKGFIVKINDYFEEISEFSEEECLGKPHNMIRHPEMPKLVFRLLWVKLRYGMEVNAFVKNITKSGGFYWVYATVSPTFKPGTKEITGYYSIRKKANYEAIEIIDAYYKELNEIESKDGKEASKMNLKNLLEKNDMKFNDLMSRLQAQGRAALK